MWKVGQTYSKNSGTDSTDHDFLVVDALVDKNGSGAAVVGAVEVLSSRHKAMQIKSEHPSPRVSSIMAAIRLGTLETLDLQKTQSRIDRRIVCPRVVLAYKHSTFGTPLERITCGALGGLAALGQSSSSVMAVCATAQQQALFIDWSC